MRSRHCAANALLREVIEATTPRSLRRRSGRKPGRPKGQPGATLEMTDQPDEVVSYEPDR
jgi:hypothetical protein